MEGIGQAAGSELPVGRWIDPATGGAVGHSQVLAKSAAISRRLAGTGRCPSWLAIAGLDATLAPAALIGAWEAGWAIAPLRWDATPADRLAMLQQLAMPLLLHDDEARLGEPCLVDAQRSCTLQDWLSEGSAPGEPKTWRPDEAAAVLFTSGSTGRPKGVLHSQCNVLRAAALFADHFGLREGDRLACLAPVHTASGLRSLAMPLVRAVDVAMWARGSGNLEQTVADLARLDPQVLLCGPRFVATLAAAGKRMRPMLPSLRCVASTGAALGAKDRDAAMHALGVEVLDFYGLSETGGIVLAEAPGSPSPGRLPPPCEGVAMQLHPVAESAGLFELLISGPNLFLGYLHSERFRRTTVATGDLVAVADDGSLSLAGRNDNAVKTDGTEWIFPERLEIWVRNLPGVRDAFVSVSGSDGARLDVLVEAEDGAQLPPASTLRQMIASELGPEYARVAWRHGKVESSELGKISRQDPPRGAIDA